MKITVILFVLCLLVGAPLVACSPCNPACIHDNDSPTADLWMTLRDQERACCLVVQELIWDKRYDFVVHPAFYSWLPARKGQIEPRHDRVETARRRIQDAVVTLRETTDITQTELLAALADVLYEASLR